MYEGLWDKDVQVTTHDRKNYLVSRPNYQFLLFTPAVNVSLKAMLKKKDMQHSFL